MPADWAFHAHDLSTVAPLGTVEVSSWYHENRLNDKGQFSCVLAAPTDVDITRTTLAATLPSRSTIWAIRTDDKRVASSMFTGWIPPGGRRPPQINGHGLLGFYDRQTLPNRMEFSTVEQALIIGLLAEVADYQIAQSGTGLIVYPGPKVALDGLTTTGVLRSQTYEQWTAKNIGEAIRDISGRINGMDFEFRTEFQAGSNGTYTPLRKLRNWYPRRGKAWNADGSGGPTFTLDHNLLSEPEIDPNMNFITTAIGLGNETNSTTQERRHEQLYNFVLLQQGWPLVSRVVDRNDITTDQSVTDQARGELLRNGVADLPDEILLDVDPNPVNEDGTPGLYQYGDWGLGDDCMVVFPIGASTWWPDGLSLQRRIIAERWTWNSSGEHCQLVTGRPWTSADGT